MSDKLKNFIQINHQQFDLSEPSAELWNKIDASMELSGPKWISSRWLSYLKYLSFGASVLLLGYFFLPEPDAVSTETAVSVFEKDTIEQSEKQILVSDDTTSPESAIHVKNAKEDPFRKPVASEKIPNEIPVAVESNAGIEEFAKEEKQVVWQTSLGSNQGGSNSSGQLLALKQKDKQKVVVDTAFSGISRLEVNASFFDINVVGTTNDKLMLHAEISSETKGIVLSKKSGVDIKLNYERKDSLLIISVVQANVNTVIIGSLHQKVELDFQIPEGVDLELKNRSGDVNVVGLKSGNCEILSTYGDIQVADITGDLKLKLTSGDLKIRNINGNVNTASTYGDQVYENITGNISSTSTSGNIRIKSVIGNLNLTSAYGDVFIEGSRGNVFLSVQSGDIVGKEVELTESAQFKTKYGDIKMNLKNEMNDLSFDLKSDYGTLKVNKGNQNFSGDKGKLSLSNGRILITGFSQSGDQYYQ